MSAPSLPLRGVTVVELGSVIAAPYAASLLAEFGAEVVKVERPDGGDALRNMGVRANGVALWWHVASRNKRLVTLDLKGEEGRAEFLALVDAADVLLENNRPGVMDRLGFGWKALSARNPRLVMASISGFSQTGPYASRPGFGKIAEAFSGAVALTGAPERIPLHVGFSLADACAGLAAVYGVAAALHARDVGGTGRGAHVDVALYEPLLRMAECQGALTRLLGSAPRRQGSNDPWGFGAPGERRIAAARCADGSWIAAILGKDSTLDLDALAAAQSRPDALATLRAAGVEAVPVQDGMSLQQDAYFTARGDVVRTQDAAAGELAVPGAVPRGYDRAGLRAFLPSGSPAE
jgi:crotonobetainyl-CoA:carnitine CoA-transferase CaiB-like acyl-CoA transferase